MALTPGYEYDVFVSYAHSDNGTGLVSHFVEALVATLRTRLGGGDELRIFFDRGETGPNTQLQDLIAAARSSATFLAIASRGYAKRRFPQDELGAFVSERRDLSRLFVVEFLPLDTGETYPEDMREHIRTQLWHSEGGLPIPLSPIHNAAAYDVLTHKVAQRLRDKLLSLRALPVARDESAAPDRSASPLRRKTVLLAQVAGDLVDDAETLRTYLGQYSDEVLVLPANDYPQGGAAFRAAVDRDLEHADLFVQLLGRRPDRTPPDLPEGYTYYQLTAAKTRGTAIMQWRRPDLDLASITDPKYRSFLEADTVIASGFEAFKRQVLDWLRRPAPKPVTRSDRASIVFIDADDNDLPFAKEIEKECLQRALTTIMPISGKSSEATRRDLADSFADSDALLFVYGDTTQNWIRSQLRFFSKVRQRRESSPRLAAIFTGPPPKDRDIGINIPDLQRIECGDGGWRIEPIRTLLAELAS